jgi:flagellin-like protein
MDERGAAPVVGTILLVAVVVVVAATVGAYGFGIADDLSDPAPQVGFTAEWDQQTRTLTLVHEAGDTIRPSNTERVEVVIRDEDETGRNDYLVARGNWTGGSAGDVEISSGDRFVITGESGGGDIDVERDGTNSEPSAPNQIHEPEVGDEVTIYWYGTEDRSLILFEYTITVGEDDNPTPTP